MFFVYILQSQKNGRYYVGYSQDPDRRLAEHNAGKVTSTRPYRPWKKMWTEEHPDEISAIRREREIKAKKSRIYLQHLVDTSRH